MTTSAPSDQLAGRVILLTGSLGILGTEFTETLAKAGASLVITDVDAAACAARAKALEETYGHKMLGLGMDVANEASVAAAARDVARHEFTVDGLVNAAAVKSPNYFAPLADYPLADWQRVLDVNLTGMFLVLRAFLPGMIERGRGTIVNISSIYGVRGPDNRIYEGSYYAALGGAINTPLIYSASKSAVTGITRYIATCYGDKGIRANSLVPGGVFSGQNDTFVRKYSDRVPMRRMARAEEMAAALLFLLSDQSSYVNGQDLIVDGGLSAW